MPEPAVFIVVGIIAGACAVAPFLYWYITSRRSRLHPSNSSDEPPLDPTDRITPIMRRLEAGSLKDLGAPGAAGLVGLGSKPVTVGVTAGGERVVLPSARRAGSGGSGSSGLSGSTFAPSSSAGPSSARPSTSTRRSPPPAPHQPPSSPHTLPSATSTSDAVPERSRYPLLPTQTAHAHAQGGLYASRYPREERRLPSTSEAPPAYEEVVDRREAPPEASTGVGEGEGVGKRGV